MLSEGELHVQAMRLVCEALADREKTGLEVDWDVINQQLDHMDVILQGIADQRNDDAEEIQILKKERDAAYERVSTVRDEVAAEIETLRKDRDHWKQAREDAIEAGELMQAEIETVRGAMAADDQRLRDAEERVWPGRTLGCDAADAMADEILSLRKQLADAQREASDEFVERQVLTAEQDQDAEIWKQQVDGAQAEVKYLRERLDEERSVSAGLQKKLTAAEAAVSLQRTGIERLNAFVEKVRDAHHFNSLHSIERALAQLDESNSSVTLTGSTEPEGGK